MRFIKFLAAGIIILLISCKALLPQPTPLLINHLIDLNNETQSLFIACSEGPIYNPRVEGCQPEKLNTLAKETREVAKSFIAGDIKQPQGYDIYLQTTLIYFRIALRTEDEYSEAERIARQFFEVQKASSGRSLNLSRFYWAAAAAEYAGWQIINKPQDLTKDRNQELLLCAAEASLAMEQIEDNFMRARIFEYIQLLVLIGGMS